MAAASHGAQGVVVTEEYIHIDSAYCTCSLSDGYYRHHNITFVNECPYCGGKLYYECAGYWVEGILVCRRCDMDFCCVHGKEHGRKGYYLTPYEFPEEEHSKDKTVSAKLLIKVHKISLKPKHAEALGF